MTEEMEIKFAEVEDLVQKVLWQKLSLPDFFEKLSEICDEIEDLETIED